MAVNIQELIERFSDDDKVLFEFGDDERKVLRIALKVLEQATGKGPFITGTGGQKDEMGLPDVLLVCPVMGLDGFAAYRKDGDYTAPGY